MDTLIKEYCCQKTVLHFFGHERKNIAGNYYNKIRKKEGKQKKVVENIPLQ
jgi:hypothetical protein